MNNTNELNDLLDIAAKKLSKELGREVTKEEISHLFSYQWKFVRNCLRGGADVTLDRFGTFSLIRKTYSRKHKYVESKGGYRNVLKVPDDPGDVPGVEVVYSKEFYPELVYEFPEDAEERKKVEGARKLDKMFGERLTGSRRKK